MLRPLQQITVMILFLLAQMESQAFIGMEIAPSLDMNQLSTKLEDEPGSKPWSLGAGLEIPLNSFQVSNNDSNGEQEDPLKKISYSPSFNPVGVIKFSYKQWGFEYSRKLAVANNTIVDKFGETQFDSLRFNLLWKFSLTEFYYQKFKGLHTDLDVDDSGERILKRPDLRFENFGVQTLIGIPIWNSDVPNSIYAFRGRPELLKTDEWSFDWILGANLNRLSLTGDEPFIPKERFDHFGSASTLSGLVNTSAGAGVGIGASVAPSPTSLVSFMGLIGGNVQRSQAEYADALESGWNVGHYINARFKWGYYGEANSFALKTIVDVWSSGARDVEIETSHVSLGLDYGYRF